MSTTIWVQIQGALLGIIGLFGLLDYCFDFIMGTEALKHWTAGEKLLYLLIKEQNTKLVGKIQLFTIYTNNYNYR